jgi:hypothetical protein
VERVDLDRQFGVVRLSRWRSHGSSSSRCRFVTVGRLADGRWFAHQSRERGGAFVFDAEQGEDLARRLAADWMTGHEWIPIPAVFGPDALPADGGAWVRRGADWFPAAPV